MESRESSVDASFYHVTTLRTFLTPHKDVLYSKLFWNSYRLERYTLAVSVNIANTCTIWISSLPGLCRMYITCYTRDYLQCITECVQPGLLLRLSDDIWKMIINSFVKSCAMCEANFTLIVVIQSVRHFGFRIFPQNALGRLNVLRFSGYGKSRYPATVNRIIVKWISSEGCALSFEFTRYGFGCRKQLQQLLRQRLVVSA